jgi:hypothetical protein
MPSPNKNFYNRPYNRKPVPQKKRVTPPPQPRPCVVLFDNVSCVYYSGPAAKFLQAEMQGDPTVFPSRKKARIAIYWTVQVMQERYGIADNPDALGELFRRFTLQYVGR